MEALLAPLIELLVAILTLFVQTLLPLVELLATLAMTVLQVIGEFVVFVLARLFRASTRGRKHEASSESSKAGGPGVVAQPTRAEVFRNSIIGAVIVTVGASATALYVFQTFTAVLTAAALAGLFGVLAASKATFDPVASPPAEPAGSPAETPDAQAAAAPSAVVVLSVIAVVGVALMVFLYLNWRQRVLKRNIAEAGLAVSAEADRLSSKRNDDGDFVHHPTPELDVVDPWKRQLLVSYEEISTGEMVLVRSTGPDRVAKTDDDIVATKTVFMPKVIGKSLLRSAAESIKDHLRPKGE